MTTAPALETRPSIRQLDIETINRISAGEVIERPSAAIKELVENAIDAGATRIRVDFADGGKTLLRVTDNGFGMTADELSLAIQRHATSKLDGDDLFNIRFFGFRGEALPSIGAVGRLSITSRAEGSGEAAQILVTMGEVSPVKPAALSRGTIVELRDIFHATPARLKFLRSDRSEAQAIAQTLRRIALSEPGIGFVLTDISSGQPPKTLLSLEPHSGDFFKSSYARSAEIIGKDFVENALPLEIIRDEIKLEGYIGVPTYSRGSATAQYFFVNGRSVQDKQLYGALRAAYQDVMSRERYPAAVLFITLPPELVDVNVHPAKSEVRFRDAGAIRGLIITAIRKAIAENHSPKTASTLSQSALSAMRPEPKHYQMDFASRTERAVNHHLQAPQYKGFEESPRPFGTSARVEPEAPPEAENTQSRLGVARAQFHETYIISQTQDGIILIDQHAAHERLVYEKLKNQAAINAVPTQGLLIPEIVELANDQAEKLLAQENALAQMGLIIEAFGQGAIIVRETPAILGEVNARALILDILDELEDQGSSTLVEQKINAILSRMSCHGSIRSGRRMQADEMNALLREMEATPNSSQCNHGRPTFIELKLSDIEKLFGRT